MPHDFKFERLPLGAYQVYLEGAHLGEVAKLGREWSSRVPEDSHPTPADRRTRHAAAERLIGMRQSRTAMAEREQPAPVPDGYELVAALDLKHRDVVITPARLTDAGEVRAWSDYGPRTVSRVRTSRATSVVSFEANEAGTDRWPHMGKPEPRQIARRIETVQTRAAAAAATRHFSATMSDFDFVTLILFQAQAEKERSDVYAYENRPWTFYDPALSKRTATLAGMRELLEQHACEIAAWWATDNGTKSSIAFRRHRAGQDRRAEHNALWAVLRHFDDEFFTLASRELAEKFRTRGPGARNRATPSAPQRGTSYRRCLPYPLNCAEQRCTSAIRAFQRPAPPPAHSTSTRHGNEKTMTAPTADNTPFDRYTDAEHAREAAALEMHAVLAATLAAMFRRGAYVRLLTRDDDDTDLSLGWILDAEGEEVYDFETDTDLPEVPPEIAAAWGGRDYRDYHLLNSVLYNIRDAGTYFPDLPEELCPEHSDWNPCIPLPATAVGDDETSVEQA